MPPTSVRAPEEILKDGAGVTSIVRPAAFGKVPTSRRGRSRPPRNLKTSSDQNTWVLTSAQCRPSSPRPEPSDSGLEAKQSFRVRREVPR